LQQFIAAHILPKSALCTIHFFGRIIPGMSASECWTLLTQHEMNVPDRAYRTSLMIVNDAVLTLGKLLYPSNSVFSLMDVVGTVEQFNFNILRRYNVQRQERAAPTPTDTLIVTLRQLGVEWGLIIQAYFAFYRRRIPNIPKPYMVELLVLALERWASDLEQVAAMDRMSRYGAARTFACRVRDSLYEQHHAIPFACG
jgi:hypothetical protein